VTPGDPTAQLERLPGVLAATVFLASPGLPRVYAAIRADADAEALRAAMVGLLHDHGYPTEPDHVHVGVAPRRAEAGGVLPRVSLDGVEVRRSETRVECTVRIRSGDRMTVGVTVEPDTATGRARAAARATLEAAEALDPDFRFGLEGVRSLDLFGLATLAVLVDATAGRAQAHLPGSALVDRSIEEAAALAALHALRAWSL
jgi:hypothetical protein